MKSTSLKNTVVNVDNNELLTVVIGEATVVVEFLVSGGVPFCKIDNSIAVMGSMVADVVIKDFKSKLDLQKRIDDLQCQLDNYVCISQDLEVIDFEE